MSNIRVTNEHQVHAVTTDSNTVELRHNAIGLLSTAALTAAYMGPALSIYVLFGPMTDKIGLGVGFVLIVATVLTLLSAISFGMLAKEHSSAGGLYAWSTAALGESAGLCIGLSTIIYYWVCLAFPTIFFGQMFNEVLKQLFDELGVTVSPDNTLFWKCSWFIGAMLTLVIAGYVAYRGITVSAHLAFTLLMIESAVIVALAATLIGFTIAQHKFTLAPITLGACNGRWHGVFLALPMALMCVLCEAAVPAGEETQNAKRTIPIAILLTCLIVGIWYVIGFSAFAMARPLIAVPANDDQNIIGPMADRVWGSARILISLTAMSAALGAFIPVITASSRMTFALAREGKLPRMFAQLHPKYLAPWNAIHATFAFTFLSVLPVFYFGQNPTIDWWSIVMGWLIVIVYSTVNIVNILYFWRFARSQFHPILNLIVPLFAFAVQLFVAWRIALADPWEQGVAGRSAQVIMFSITAATIAYALFMRNRSFLLAPSDAEIR